MEKEAVKNIFLSTRRVKILAKIWLNHSSHSNLCKSAIFQAFELKFFALSPIYHRVLSHQHPPLTHPPAIRPHACCDHPTHTHIYHRKCHYSDFLVSHTSPKEIAITRPFSKQLTWNFFWVEGNCIWDPRKKFQANCFENGRVIAISLGGVWDTPPRVLML